MALRACRILLVAAAFVAADLAGGLVFDPSDGFRVGAARAQSDASTLRLTGGDIVRASHSRDRATGSALIEVRLSPEASARVRDFTTAHVSRKVDFRVDGRPIMSPVIQTPIAGGSFVITGRFTEDEARTMAAALGKAGSLLEISLAD
jgi:preprotein translocase subunit SecD